MSSGVDPNEIEKLIDDKAKESDSWMKQYLLRIKKSNYRMKELKCSELQFLLNMKWWYPYKLDKGGP